MSVNENSKGKKLNKSYLNEKNKVKTLKKKN